MKSIHIRVNGMTLRELRERRGVTQAALAKRLGVRPQRVLNLERAANLKVETLSRYLAAIGMDIHIKAYPIPRSASSLNPISKHPNASAP